jgi:hypothetical protein
MARLISWTRLRTFCGTPIAYTHIKPAGEKIDSLVEFRNHKVYKANPKEFGLGQFDLPEPHGASSMYQDEPRWYLWFLGLAIICLAVGVYFRRRSRQGNLEKA